MGFGPTWRHHDSKRLENDGGGDEFLSRVPYASIIATSMCCIGVILFAFVMAWASNASVEQARRTFNIENLPWLAKIQVLFVAVTALIAIAALLFLSIGALSTGSTRKELYRGVRGRIGGKMANAFALITAYVLNICWIICFAFVTILCFVYYIFTILCSSLSFTDTDCLDFSLFQPIVQHISNAPLKLCGGDVQQFCAFSWSAFAWYLIGLISCLVIIKGLEHFMICSAANYAHINSGLKYLELRELLLSADPDAMKSELRTLNDQVRPRAGSTVLPDHRLPRSYLA